MKYLLPSIFILTLLRMELYSQERNVDGISAQVDESLVGAAEECSPEMYSNVVSDADLEAVQSIYDAGKFPKIGSSVSFELEIAGLGELIETACEKIIERPAVWVCKKISRCFRSGAPAGEKVIIRGAEGTAERAVAKRLIEVEFDRLIEGSVAHQKVVGCLFTALSYINITAEICATALQCLTSLTPSRVGVPLQPGEHFDFPRDWLNRFIPICRELQSIN